MGSPLVARSRRAVLGWFATGATPMSATQIVTAVAVRPILATALDRLVTFEGFVPQLDPSVEMFVGPLLRSKSTWWDRSWEEWCAGPDARAVREELWWDLREAFRQRGWSVEDCPADDAMIRRLGRAASEAADEWVRRTSEELLPSVLAHYIVVVTNALGLVQEVRDPWGHRVVEGYLDGNPKLAIAEELGTSVGNVYTLFSRMRQRVGARMATRLPPFMLRRARPRGGRPLDRDSDA
jgi:hypothetical protein